MKSLVTFAVAMLPVAAAIKAPPRALELRTAADGWTLAMTADADHYLFDAPSFAPARGRAVLTYAVRSPDYKKLTSSAAAIVGADGKTVHVQELPGLLVQSGDLSPDGKIAAVVASPYDDPDGAPFLYVFDEKGTKIGKRRVAHEDSVLVGNGWIALWSAPALVGQDDGAEEDDVPPSQTVEPATFLEPNGTPIRTTDRIGGALANAGDGLVSVASGQLSVYRQNLTRRGRAELGFSTGLPTASENGTLIAVADFTAEERAKRPVLLFDADAKKLGEIPMKAVLGVDVAISPDGTAVAATPASIGGDAETALTVEDSKEFDIVLADRTGKIRWRTTITRRSPTDHVAFLHVAPGGSRVVFAQLAQDDEETPPQIVVLDAKGAETARITQPLTRLWLDAKGESIYFAVEGALERRSIESLSK